MGKQAVLPKDRVKKTVGSLKTGESGYISTGAIVVGEDRTVWINTKYSVREERGKHRVSREDDGFHVWLDPDKKFWTLKNKVIECKQEKGELAPFVEVH